MATPRLSPLRGTRLTDTILTLAFSGTTCGKSGSGPAIRRTETKSIPKTISPLDTIDKLSNRHFSGRFHASQNPVSASRLVDLFKPLTLANYIEREAYGTASLSGDISNLK